MIGNTNAIDDDSDLDDRLERRAQIARPNLSSGMPAVTLRGLPAPAPSPAPPTPAPAAGSTEDLEAKASQSHMTPRPIAAPSPLEQRTTADETEANRLQTTGSGISQIKNPFARNALRGLETIGNVFLPRTMSVIPGTEAHHRELLSEARGRIGEDLGESQKIATTDQTAALGEEQQATARLRNAQADVAKDPKTGLTPEEVTIHDLMTGENGGPRINAQTQKPYTYMEAYTAVKQAQLEAKPPQKPDSPEQQFLDAQAAVDNAKTPEEKAAAQAKLDQLKKALGGYSAVTQKPEKPGAGNARSDKSYQYNNDKLDKLAKPIEDAVGRMGRIRESLAQGTPQADALIAPELLTVMAGGAGSGLRMNEAEISRVVGGRSKWESLKASIQQWSLDPKTANSITEEQRKQIHSLVDAVNAKLLRKQQALDKAREALLDTDDPKEHRRIVTQAHSSLTSVDEEQPHTNTDGQSAKTVTIGGQEIPLAADGTFEYQGHTYKDNGDRKGATLVK